MDSLVDDSIIPGLAQFFHLRFRSHSRRGSRMIVRARVRDRELAVEIVSLGNDREAGNDNDL